MIFSLLRVLGPRGLGRQAARTQRVRGNEEWVPRDIVHVAQVHVVRHEARLASPFRAHRCQLLVRPALLGAQGLLRDQQRLLARPVHFRQGSRQWRRTSDVQRSIRRLLWRDWRVEAPPSLRSLDVVLPCKGRPSHRVLFRARVLRFERRGDARRGWSVAPATARDAAARASSWDRGASPQSSAAAPAKECHEVSGRLTR